MSWLFSIYCAFLYSSGDYQKALGNLGLLADIENSESDGESRRRRSSSRKRRVAADQTGETSLEQLELIELTLTETVLTISSAQLLIDNTASLLLSDVTLEDQSKYRQVQRAILAESWKIRLFCGDILRIAVSIYIRAYLMWILIFFFDS